MNWGPQQDRGLIKVHRWLSDPGGPQVFRLFGFAGTGKTTLAKHLASGIDGKVIFAAYTGKAASVLLASGAPNARTLHSLIYNPKDRSQERLLGLKQELREVQAALEEGEIEPAFLSHWKDRAVILEAEIVKEKQNLKRPSFTLNLESDLVGAALLVVDEVSQVNEEMAMDILAFGVKVLVLGDPAQLPPVRGTGWFIDTEPDVMLTEIHRQARDNPIIALATAVREGRDLEYGAYGSSSVIRKATPELALDASQILVGRNKTRLTTNRRMRSLLGFSANPFPFAKEKLLCRRNNADLGLLNGTLHYTTEDSEEFGGFVSLRITPEGSGSEVLISAHREYFDGDPDNIGRWSRMDAQEMEYGYAITVHSAQGSQWRDVLLIDEWFMWDTRQKWLYTAITRAQEKITIVRD